MLGSPLRQQSQERNQAAPGLSSFGWLEWALTRLWVIGVRCMNNLHRLKNNTKMNKNEETKSLMIGNVPKVIEVAWREVVVGEVGTGAPEFLVAVPIAIHVAMQLVLKVLICAW
jgi:hypothetical protein